MSFFSKLRGTVETLFRIGVLGPNLKSNAGFLEARDVADAAYACFRGGLNLPTTFSVTQLQGGTMLAPATETPLTVQVIDPAYGAFSIEIDASPSFGTNDYAGTFGYNVTGALVTVPTMRLTFESDFNDGANHSIEMHVQYAIPLGWYGAAAAYAGRVLTSNAFPDGQQNVGLGFHSNWPTNTGQIKFEDSFDAFQPLVIDRSTATFRSSPGAFSSPTVKMITGENNAQSGVGFCRADATIRGWDTWAGSLGSGLATGVRIVAGVSGTGIAIGRMDGNTANRREMISIDDNYDGIQLCSFGGMAPLTTDFGAGVGVVGVTKAVTNPTTDPAGYIAYAEHTSGAAKVRDALGADCNLSGGFFAQAMADADQVISAANSASKFYRTTGANTAVRALTISLPANKGTMVIVRNDCTVSGITVQFLAGAATGTILPGTAAVVGCDGANAFVLLTGT